MSSIARLVALAAGAIVTVTGLIALAGIDWDGAEADRPGQQVTVDRLMELDVRFHETIAELAGNALAAGGKLMFCGNGGSAAVTYAVGSAVEVGVFSVRRAYFELLERCAASLENEESLRNLEFTVDEENLASGFGFLSRKPLLVIVNRSEEKTGAELEPRFEEELRRRSS